MFEKLEYVYAVYQERSFTKAAEKLFIAQPSLSAAIKGVEKEIGAPLFDRTRKVTLTEIGKEYIAAAEKMLRAEEEFVSRIHDIYGLETGKIVIGGTNYLSSHVLPPIIKRFSSRFPKIEVTLVEANSTVLGEMLGREEIDLVVDSFDEQLQLYEGTPLTSERIFLCVPASFKINEKLKEYAVRGEMLRKGNKNKHFKSVPVSAFKDEPFVLLKSGNDMYNRAMRIFQKEKISPKVAFSVDQLNISYALAQSGMGSCFVTDTLVRYGNRSENVVFYSVGEESCNRTLYVAHKKNKYCSNAAKKFIEIAQQSF